MDAVPALARWLHFMAGIMWVGLLYYFNFVQMAALKSAAADGGGVTESRVVISDINARKLAELETQRLAAALQEKKQELETFLYITTHDMRGSLTNIDGYSQNLAADFNKLCELIAPAPPPEESRAALRELTEERIPEAIKYITEDAKKLFRILDGLLQVFRLGKVEMRPEVLNVNAIVKNALDTFRYQLEEAGSTVITGEMPPCKADAKAVDHIFKNLLANSVKYRSEFRKLQITVNGKKNGPATVLYTITDNSIGIKDADITRIWEIFYSGNNPKLKKGQGIGLAISKMMAEKTGGRLWAESKDGEGTTFFLEMPV